jgi:hypothetical protein
MWATRSGGRILLGVDALDVLHRQPQLAAVLPAVEHRDDVAVGESGDHVGLAEEAPGEVGVDRELGLQQLQRVQPRQPGMLHEVHRAHAAAAQLADHRVPGDGLARVERHGSLLRPGTANARSHGCGCHRQESRAVSVFRRHVTVPSRRA